MPSRATQDAWPADLRVFAENLDLEADGDDTPLRDRLYLITREVYHGFVLPTRSQPQSQLKFAEEQHRRVVEARDYLSDHLVPQWRRQLKDGRDKLDVVREANAWMDARIHGGGRLCSAEDVIETLQLTDELGDSGFVVSGGPILYLIHRMRH